MSSKNYEVHDDGSITFAEGVEITDAIRKNAEKAALKREKASDVEDDVELRETAEGKTEREKASN